MASETNPKQVMKRAREEIGETASGGGSGSGGAWKGGKDDGKKVVVSLGTMEFTTSLEILTKFKGLMLNWLPNYPLDDVWAGGLLDLVKEGHPEPEKMIGCGVHSFRVRLDNMCSHFRTYYIFRKDGSKADFCFRSCIDRILPLPEDVKDHGNGVVAVCACHVAGGMKGVLAARSAEQRERFRQARPTSLYKEDEAGNSFILGQMKFGTSSQMYGYFFSMLMYSPLNQPLTKNNAHKKLLDLLEKGDPESEKKIGSGIESFQVRIHPAYDSGLRSFYLVRRDGSMEDFCFIKCVETICPLTGEWKEQCVGPCSCHHEIVGKASVTLGWRRFWSSLEMVSYFKNLMNEWPFNTPIDDAVTHTVVLDLLKKGDPEWDKKIAYGGGLQSLQIRRHPVWFCPLYFVVRKDGSMEPFCHLTCIDNILPLPEEYKTQCAPGGAGVKSRREGAKGGGGSGRGTRRRYPTDFGLKVCTNAGAVVNK